MTRRAFTLAEVLIAIVLLAVLSASVFTLLQALGERRTRVLESTETARGASAAIEAVEDALLTCIAGGPRVGAGVRGDGESLRVLHRRAGLGIPGEPTTDLVALDLRWDGRTGDLALTLGDPFDAAASASAPSPALAASGIRRVRIRYHDGTGWRDRFDSAAAGALPLAVDVSLWVGEVERADAGPTPADLAGEFGTLPPPPGESFPEFEQSPAPDPRDEPLPPPDRRRIIAIPDAAPADPQGMSEALP